ncbi:MAG: hypothetical protein APF84_04750 [Gracilibacter sp. BRH_c7a]|nr:MAG: hypothetical protein APF84_04750 [Gracilibacter sp. BRH_c7a]
MTRNKKFLIAVLIPLLILIGLTIIPVKTMLYGQEILLETRAVDPTDLFRGDYIIVSPKISQIPKTKFPSMELDNNKKIYVLLKQEGPYHVVDSIATTQPQEGLYLEGRIPFYYFDSELVQVDYSLDKYFIPQGSGKQLEDASFRGNLIAKVKVLDGYGLLTDIEIGTERT